MTTFQKAERRFERVDQDLHKLAGLLEDSCLENEAVELDQAADAIERVRERLETLKAASARLFGECRSRSRSQASEQLSPASAEAR